MIFYADLLMTLAEVSLPASADIPEALRLKISREWRREFPEFKEIRHPTGPFKALVEVFGGPWNSHIFPEFSAQLPHEMTRLFKALVVAGHTAVLPHDLTELTMKL